MHGLTTILPFPWHELQVLSIVKNPWLASVFPEPWQLGHMMGASPFSPPLPEQVEQVVFMGTLIVSDLPLKASSSEISKLYLKSEPLFADAFDLDVEPKSPKKSLNISEKEDEKFPSKPAPPCPLPADPSKAA